MEPYVGLNAMLNKSKKNNNRKVTPTLSKIDSFGAELDKKTKFNTTEEC